MKIGAVTVLNYTNVQGHYFKTIFPPPAVTWIFEIFQKTSEKVETRVINFFKEIWNLFRFRTHHHFVASAWIFEKFRTFSEIPETRVL